MNRLLAIFSVLALTVALLPEQARAHGFPGPATINVSTSAPAPSPGPSPAPGPGGRTANTPKGGFTGKGRLGESRTTPSPARMLRVTVDWMGTLPPRAESFGYGASVLPLNALLTEAHAPEGVRAGIPSLVYFVAASDDQKLLEYEARVFHDERIGVTSHLLNCFRIGYEDLNPAEKKVYGDGTKGPRLVLMDGEGKVVKTFEGWRTDAGKLYRTLNLMVKLHYKEKLASLLEKEAEILDTLDRTYYDAKVIEAQKKVVAERLAKKECASCRKVLGKLETKMQNTKDEKAAALEREKKILGAAAAKF